MSDGAQPSHSVTGNAAIIAVTVVLTIAIVSGAIIYGLWTFRKTSRGTSTLRNEHILHRPPGQLTSEGETLEMGNPFSKSESYGPEPLVFPYFRPYNLASYLPSAPSPEELSRNSPVAPPGLPPCRVLNAARIPVIIMNHTHVRHSVKAVFEQTSQRHLQPSSSSMSMAPVIEEFDPGDDSTEASIQLESIKDLSLALNDDKPEGKVVSGFKDNHVHVTSEKTNFEGAMVLGKQYAPNLPSSPVSLVPSPLSLQLPSPPTTPTLPTLVVTSASIARGLVVRKGGSQPTSYYPSPPQTPKLVITSPSIHYFSTDMAARGQTNGTWDNNETENWSDVLGLEDYVDEESRILESPPRQSIRDGGIQKDDAHARAKAPFDHAAFRTRLAAFTLANQKSRAAYTAQTAHSPSLLTLSRNAEFDYGRLLARKRANSVSTISLASTQRDLPIQIPGPVTCRERRSPLPGSF